jgi:hypothetical protein
VLQAVRREHSAGSGPRHSGRKGLLGSSCWLALRPAGECEAVVPTRSSQGTAHWNTEAPEETPLNREALTRTTNSGSVQVSAQSIHLRTGHHPPSLTRESAIEGSQQSAGLVLLILASRYWDCASRRLGLAGGLACPALSQHRVRVVAGWAVPTSFPGVEASWRLPCLR